MVTTVIVLGHHRGGTSLVAGLLDRIGVRMGPKNARPSWSGHHWSNPAGHYENQEFVWLNTAIVAFDGAGIHMTPAWREVAARAVPFRERIATTVRANEGGLWGWKDPWTVLTLAEYLPTVTDPRLVIVRRDVRAVADSLHRRDGTGKEEALAIAAFWEERLSGASAGRAAIPTLELRYEEVVADPGAAVDALARFVGVTPSPEVRRRALQLVLDPRSLRREAKRLAVRELATFPKWLGWFVSSRIRYARTEPIEIVRSSWTELAGALRTVVGTASR